MTSPTSSQIGAIGYDGLPYFTPANNGGAAAEPENPSTPTLFRPLHIRQLTLKNRIMVAPMCMYSCQSDPSSPFVGALTDYHIAHLGNLALKGVGLIIIEATAVQANGRISPNDSGLWQEGTDSEQFKALKRVVDFVHSQGAKIAIQLAHAGRKASSMPPWVAQEAGKRSLRAGEAAGGWPHDVVGPSGGEEQAWAPGDSFWPPRELSTAEVEETVKAFARSAELSVKAGFDLIEIHGAHGYLVNQFLSPVTNKRTDKYGGTFENRTRILREISGAIRAVIPESMPLFLRISATEWLDGKFPEFWDIESSIKLAKTLPDLGIDFLDVSSGGNHKDQTLEPHTNYQIDLAAQIRKEIREVGQKTLIGAVGLITEATAASQLVQGSDLDEAHAAESMVAGSAPRADAVLLARQFLRQADWVYHAAKTLGVQITVPKQLGRAI
ncbi:FMN-linked oxidoreductase [Penicillium daleae]|jgi:2,4-dienoyl-CoA reductase-like NADH-dependent reductase (Old Yellow Enzyme family)|uniref:FMN-linked oxidoreductase n=1 Tax=Penicillium daleae TaxID=63821 RepID=A0AAD6G2Y5_9EURO|nr:FMN-linked oxidoreductase [Penicillium daleae]KAJ5450040.1 FMN-linked oxidoreductase [Penicillium daleae]